MVTPKPTRRGRATVKTGLTALAAGLVAFGFGAAPAVAAGDDLPPNIEIKGERITIGDDFAVDASHEAGKTADNPLEFLLGDDALWQVETTLSDLDRQEDGLAGYVQFSSAKDPETGEIIDGSAWQMFSDSKGLSPEGIYRPDFQGAPPGSYLFEGGFAFIYEDSEGACGLETARSGDADLGACEHIVTVGHYIDIEEVSPSISVDKVATDLGSGSESDPARYTRGDKVQWDYTIENTGNILVHTIDLVDDQGVEVTFPESFEGALAPGESVTATGSATIEDASYTNVADVVAYTECQAPMAPSSIGGGVSLMSAGADEPTYAPNPGEGELWPVPLCPFDDQSGEVDRGYKVSASDAWHGVIAPGTLVVNHVDEQGNELAPSTSDEGDVGSDYTTAPAEIDGYELIAVPENAEGEYIEGEIIVTYVYAPIVEPTPDPEDPTPTPEPEDPAPTPEPEDPNGEDPSDPEAEELPELEETGVSVGALIAGALTLITAGAGAVTIRRNRLSN